MDRCHENSERLLDFLYGLLELSEAEGVKEHLAQCRVCRDSLLEAQVERRMLARAAQVYEHVPEFKLPADEAEAEFPMVESAPVAAAATLPFAAPQQRRWLIPTCFATAAALMIAVYGVRSYHQSGLAALQNDVGLAHTKIEKNAAEASRLQAKLEEKRDDVLNRLAAQSLHLVAMGPTVLDAGAQSPLRVLVQDLQGKPRDATVQIRLVEEKTQKAIFEKALVASAGVVAFHVPPLPAGTMGAARLYVSTADGADAIEEKVRLAASSLVTHLATNKIAYSPGELLFFRTVTLERFSLRPTAEKLRLKFVLRDAFDDPVKQFFGTTAVGGIAGGEIALAENTPAGEYTLEISEAAETGRMSPVRRTVNVLAKGDGKAAQMPADNSVFVDFFPEGGELVAGVESRIYYRVRNSRGESADFAGQLVLGSTAVSSFSPGPAGSLGVFAFTPKMGETYQAKVARPGLAAVSVPCRLHELVREQGVVLSIPTAVRADDALRVEVQNTASERMLLAVAMCRGRVVDQQLFLAKAGKSEVTLNPIAGAHGVVRVTVYDGERPLAERLVYRPSTRHLKLSANRKSGTSPFGAQQITMQVQAMNEQNELTPAWFLAYVADSKIARKPGNELSGHFFLAGELDSPEALEATDIFAGDDPQSHGVADLFLGTHGWRRIVRSEKTPAALAKVNDQEPARTLFCRENGSLAKLQERAAGAVAQATAALQQEGNKERARLVGEREQAELELRVASAELAVYRNRPQTWLRLAGAAAVLTLLVMGIVCLAWGFVQVARRRLATPAFGGAAASLGVCLFLFALAGHLNTSVESPGGIAKGRGTLPDVDLKPTALAQAKGPAFPLGYMRGFAPASTALTELMEKPLPVGEITAIAAADMKIRYKQALDREAGDKSKAFTPSNEKQAMVAPGTLKKPEPKVEDKTPAPRTQLPPADLFAREYAFRQVKKESVRQDMVLWSPMLILQKGTQQVSFDVPADVASFRMFLFGHSADGRFGFHEERITNRE